MGAGLLSDNCCQLGEVVADQRYLAGGGEMEVEGSEHVGEGVGVFDGRFAEEGEDRRSLLFVTTVAGQSREAEQAHRRRAVAGGDRVDAYLLAADDQLLVVGRGRVEA